MIGPVIFTGNHQNQFVDAAMIVITNPHTISFLIAETSYYHPIVGAFARIMRAIPVSRPQDSAKVGPGKVWFDGFKALGDGTHFLSLSKGDRIRPGRSADAYRIK